MYYKIKLYLEPHLPQLINMNHNIIVCELWVQVFGNLIRTFPTLVVVCLFQKQRLDKVFIIFYSMWIYESSRFWELDRTIPILISW
jgi:hypothetical protein